MRAKTQPISREITELPHYVHVVTFWSHDLSHAFTFRLEEGRVPHVWDQESLHYLNPPSAQVEGPRSMCLFVFVCLMLGSVHFLVSPNPWQDAKHQSALKAQVCACVSMFLVQENFPELPSLYILCLTERPHLPKDVIR